MECKNCALISYHIVTRRSWKNFLWETVIDLINIWFSFQFQRRPCQSFKIKNLEKKRLIITGDAMTVLISSKVRKLLPPEHQIGTDHFDFHRKCTILHQPQLLHATDHGQIRHLVAVPPIENFAPK